MIRLRTTLALLPSPPRSSSAPIASLVAALLLSASPAFAQPGEPRQDIARDAVRDAARNAVRDGAEGGAPPESASRPSALPGAPWSAEVAVSGRGADEQLEAQRIAMRAVLLANSGDKTLLNRDDVREGLREARDYVERFDYRTPPPGTVIASGTPLTDEVRRTGEATQLMLVRFDRGLLEGLIGRETPAEANADEAGGPAVLDPFASVDSALVWLLIEDGRREILISDPAARNVRARAREIAGGRGVALVYPNGDEEDRSALGVDALREGELDRLRAASERYGEPVVLVGRLARDGLERWEGRWLRFATAIPESAESEGADEGRAGVDGSGTGEATNGRDTAEETFSTGSLDEALQAGLGWLSAAEPRDSDYRYGGTASSDAEALVWIGPLDSVGAYATVMTFLEGVAGVGTVYPKEIDERGMAFSVVPRGALPAIASAADAQDWLRRTTPPEEPPGSRAGPLPGRSSDVALARGVSDGTLPSRGPSRDPSRDPSRGDPRRNTDPRFGEGVAATAAGGGNPGRTGEGDRSASGGSTYRGGAFGRAVPVSLARNAELAFEYLR